MRAFPEKSVKSDAGAIDLVVMPYHDYRKNEIEGFRGRDSHFLEMLITNSDRFRSILVIDRPVSLLEHVLRGQSWHIRSGTVALRGCDWRVSQIGDRVCVLNHLALSLIEPVMLRHAWWDMAFASQRFGSIVKHVCEVLAIDRAVVLLHHPFGVRLLQQIHGCALVFDAMDNFLALKHFVPVRVALKAHYDMVADQAAQIFAVTEKAAISIFGSMKNIKVLPNGVSPDFIRTPRKQHSVKQLRLKRRPFIGYVGALSERVDASLLAEVARSLPDCFFVLAGPIMIPDYFAELRRMPNVSFVGFIPYDEVPSLIHDFDCCMIPHAVGRELDGDGDCIKLYEYIAANKPVVTTPVQGADRFGAYIRIARDPEGFATAIQSFVKAGSFGGYPPSLLDGLTWQDRFKPLLETILSVGCA